VKRTKDTPPGGKRVTRERAHAHGQSPPRGEIKVREESRTGKTGVSVVSLATDSAWFEGAKWCSRCRRWLERESFRANPEMLSGLHPWCRGCASAYAREWRQANPEAMARYRAQQRADYAAAVGPLERRRCINPECGRSFLPPKRRDAQTCSKTCRDRLRYLRRKGRA
jgi:hypothetical protein